MTIETKEQMVKVEINKKTLDRINNLFEEKKLKPIRTVKGILNKVDSKMRDCLIEENKKRRKRNYSEALINENYFFALFFLKEEILGKDLNVHKERRKLLKKVVKNLK